jgi:hypothetical protein
MAFKLEGTIAHLHLPQWLQRLHQQLLSTFNHPQNANFLFSLLTGEKKGLSPGLLKDLECLNLRFLLSPSGLHLTGFLFFLKKRKAKFPIYLACWLLPTFYSMKRMAFLHMMTFLKKPISQINLLYITFIFSFICGHFYKSPQGFTYSFLIIGTFFSLNHMSLVKCFLAIAASHLLIAFFQGNDFSFVAMTFSLILVQIFSMLFPVFLIFIGSFYFIHSHWIEPVIRFFILLIHYAAKFSQGTFLTSSFMLLCLVWILLLDKNKKWILVCLLLHAGLAQAPAIFFNS